MSDQVLRSSATGPNCGTCAAGTSDGVLYSVEIRKLC